MRHTPNLLRVLFCGALVAFCLPASADDAVFLTKQQLVERYPELTAANISDSPIQGFYEVAAGGTVLYVSKDGKYMLRGDLTELQTQRNLTEVTRSNYRATRLATLDPKSEIVFSPKNGEVKYRAIVFTDVDCGYCRALHRNIDEITARGIEVHYVSYPRTGPNTESWTKAEHVWCASDRNRALTTAKLGADVQPDPSCKTTPIATHYELGRAVGMTGTPAIYAVTGEEVGGYLEPDALLARLEQIAAQH
jgi:thiol:disulfide interchange protein DsbC